jgi:tetratricopeptide (TPR) repeat protein
MRSIRIGLTVFIACLATVASAQEHSAEVEAAEEASSSGDLDGALKRLEAVLGADDLDAATRRRAQQIASRVLQTRGEAHFRQAKIAAALADFDRQIELQPEAAAQHWQRGIACYYAGEYKKGAEQFELHQTVNPQDVENAAWHFLCRARSEGGSVDAARKGLIAVTRDPRVPMAEIQAMFAGTKSAAEVLQAGQAAGGMAQFYAQLYAGLYHEALGEDEESLRLLKLAAANPAAEDTYMADVARVHVALRGNNVLRHAVFFKFKDATAKRDVERVVEAFRALPAKIREIREFQCGESVGQSGSNDGLTHCFLITFADEAGRAAYLPHSEHKAFVEIAGPHLDKVFVIDYWGRAKPSGSEKSLKHAVFFKFRDGTPADEIRKVEEGLATLPAKIDTIRAFEWGTNNSPETHDQGFTHCFLFTFDSEEALNQYAAHPAHTAVVDELKPIVEKVRVLDFWVGDQKPTEEDRSLRDERESD